MIRSVNHVTVPDGWIVLDTLSTMTAGSSVGPALGLLAAAVAIIALGLTVDRRPLALILAFLVLPIGLLFLVSHALRPAWHLQNFVVILPILTLILAAALVTLYRTFRGRRLRMTLVLAAAALVLVMAERGRELAAAPKPNVFQTLAGALRAQAEPGDTILATDNFAFWSLARYAAGPR